MEFETTKVGKRGTVVIPVGNSLVPETWVAVGTLVTQRPPHRSERAALPHSALASGDDAKAYQRIRMTNTGRRKPSVHEAFHSIPNQAMFVAPAS